MTQADGRAVDVDVLRLKRSLEMLGLSVEGASPMQIIDLYRRLRLGVPQASTQPRSDR
jgi:hypothetical protein